VIDLLRDPLFSVAVSGRRRDCSLTGVLAALATGDEIETFTALRPHQRFPWRAFLVQLAAHALEVANQVEPPVDEDSWRELLRGLTREWPGDEPWNLVVEDLAEPAFLQPPVPEGSLAGWSEVATADDLDILVTSKNHGVKTGQAAASGRKGVTPYPHDGHGHHQHISPAAPPRGGDSRGKASQSGPARRAHGLPRSPVERNAAAFLRRSGDAGGRGFEHVHEHDRHRGECVHRGFLGFRPGNWVNAQ